MKAMWFLMSLGFACSCCGFIVCLTQDWSLAGTFSCVVFSGMLCLDVLTDKFKCISK